MNLGTIRWGAAVLLLFACLSGSCTRSVEGDDLEVWIGQMLLVGFRGTSLEESDDFLKQIRELHLGGVVLFDYDVPTQSRVRNVVSAEQVKALTRRLHNAAQKPLLVSIDQEGGRIARLKERHGFPASRSQAELGRLDPDQTRAQAKEVGELLRSLGINLNFSPVLDLAVNPDNPVIAKLERSFGADPERVALHGEAAIEGYHQAGILCAVKHFPGHGSSTADSHLGLPDVSEVWRPVELKPFELLIQKGLPDLVMTAHLFNRHWDPEMPATLSERVITGMLRTQLGFNGVVVSDDLGMGAITQHHSLEETIRRSVEGGVDILLFGNNLQYDPQIARKAAETLGRLVRSNIVPRERIRQSYQRISRLKERIPQEPFPPETSRY